MDSTDGKKITKKKGMNLDDLNLSPLLDKKSSNLECLPENKISRRNSRNMDSFELEKQDYLNNHVNDDENEKKEEKFESGL